jgi:hypothetical protein
MKTLLTNGCSWTSGGGMHEKYNDYERLNVVSWPNPLSKLLQVDKFVNLAAGCGSNQRIFRTTFDWILSQPVTVLENTIAVIQWTEAMRYEYFVPKNNNPNDWDSEDVNGWAAVKLDVVLSLNENNFYSQEELVDRSNKRFMTYTSMEGTYRNFSYFEALSSIFKRYGIEYYYWDMTSSMNSIPNTLRDYAKNYNWLEENGCHRWEYDRVSKKDPHPSERGGVQIANQIYEAMRKHNYYGKY